MPLLVIERGENKGTSVTLEPGKAYVFGRDNAQSGIPLKDALASRNHFEIRAEADTWFIQDLKSRNGTILNDERLPPMVASPLKIGDKVQVGETILSFLSDAKEESAGGLVGKVLGGYRIQERVGRGGMGTVYKAEQMSLHRVVALKVLSAKLLSDASFVEKFVAEARAAGQLNHPNIVQVFDVGSDRGVHYFSMELMAPESVGDVVAKQGPVPWQRALEMMTDAAKGLIYAEKRGIVHRDIKPDNLMLTPEGTVKIGDLGLAKRAEETQGEGGAIFGTPHFISPEQAQGKPVDNRADIYSLGAAFYRILSGKTPFTGENVKEILVKQINADPPPLEKVVADIPPEMCLVIEKMMKKRPDDRYRSAQGLLDDLESIRIDHHLESKGVAKTAKRTKIAAALLLVALIGVGVYAYQQATRPPEYRDRIIDNQPRNTGPTGPVTPLQTPEEKAEEAFKVVKLADNDFCLSKARGQDPWETKTWKTLADDWKAIAKKYDDMAAAHPDTSAATQAIERAAYIRKRMKDAADDETRRGTEAAQAWETLRTKVVAELDAGRIGEALLLLGKPVAEVREKHRDHLAQGIDKAVRELRDRAFADAEARVRTLIEELERTAGLFPGDAFAAALARVKGVVDGLRPPGGFGTDKEAAGEIDPRLARLDTARKAAEVKARATIDQVLAADATAYETEYLEIRRFAPADASPEAPCTPFFDYRWDEAIERWRALLKTLRTDWYRERVARKIAHYERSRAVFRTVTEKINAGELKNPGFPADVRKGSSLLILDRSPSAPAATMDGCPIQRRVGTAMKPEPFEYRRLTPREFYVDFLKECAPGKDGCGWEPTGEQSLDLAVFLAEAGEGLLAVRRMGEAQRAGWKPAQDDPLHAWFLAELVAYTEHAGPGGIVDDFARYENAVREDALPRVLEPLRQNLAERIDAFLANQDYRKTDYYILQHSSLAGGKNGRPPLVVPATLRDELLRGYGLPSSGTTAPPGGGAERKSPDPAPTNGGGRGPGGREPGNREPDAPEKPGRDRSEGGKGSGSRSAEDGNPPAPAPTPERDTPDTGQEGGQ